MKTYNKLGGQHLPGNNMPVDVALKKLGEMIRSKRLDINVTQSEVAAHTGVSESVVKRLESGKPVSSENLAKIMMALTMLKDLLNLYEKPEISLKERFELQKKAIKSKRHRASKKALG
jgi:transcriptional regulator with XRE-family HTH domain